MSWWRDWFGASCAARPSAEPAPDPAPEAPDTAEPVRPPIRLEVADVLNLHTFAPRDVKDVVEAYLEEAHARGFPQVRIIHGKGIGVQREMVRAILRRTAFVVHYEEAPAEAGSWGATVAWLSGPAESDTQHAPEPETH